jgi:hypothetical protein
MDAKEVPFQLKSRIWGPKSRLFSPYLILNWFIIRNFLHSLSQLMYLPSSRSAGLD